MYKRYELLRPLAVFAGVLGILQSIAWIAISVMGLIAYFCLLNFRGMEASLGTLTELVLFQIYFHGPCSQSGLPNMDYTPLNRLNLMKPIQVHVCMWLYLVFSSLLLASSITLLTSVRYNNLRNANYFLCVWIFLIFSLSLLDLGYGIAFSIDFETLRSQAHGVLVSETTNSTANYLLTSAKTATTAMLVLSFRGFTLWAINILLAIYFIAQTFKIADYNRAKKGFVSSEFTPSPNLRINHTPTNGYRCKCVDWTEMYPTWETQTLDRAPKQRTQQAAALFEERKRHYEAQQLNYLRYINKRDAPKSQPKGVTNFLTPTDNPNIRQKTREILVPTPDYNTENTLHRSESFESRPPVRSSLHASYRY